MSVPGKEIHRSYDEFGAVRVFDDGNKRYLSFCGDDEQSCLLKSAPHILQHHYSRAMLLSLLFVEPRDAVLLGLGGGGVVHALRHQFPGIKLRCVERSSVVIDLAYRYFQLSRNKRTEILHMDAEQFLADVEQRRTDLLMCDLFDGDGLNRQQLQSEFIAACRGRLKSGGWLVLNCWREHRVEGSLMSSLEQHFEDIRLCATSCGNWVILAGAERNSDSAKLLRQRAKTLSASLEFSLVAPLGRMVEHKFSY